MDRAQRSRQRNGAVVEQMVAHRLRAAGLVLVERVETGWRIVRNPMGRIVGAHPVAKVSGDFRAVAPGGRSVLVEVKWRKSGKLAWTDLESHQHAALDTHDRAGGLSIVAFASPDGVGFSPYRDLLTAGWRPGHPLSVADMAQAVPVPPTLTTGR